MLNQVSIYFGDILPFLQEQQGIAPATTRKLLDLVEAPHSAHAIRLQLAAFIDIRKHFVQATYALEGDGPLVFSCYRILQFVATALIQKDCPNLKATAREIGDEDAIPSAPLVTETLLGAQPAITWFSRKFNMDVGETVTMFRRARFFDPVAAQSLDITPDKVRSLSCLPF